ncbi:MAG: TldD/PmbA family protein [Rhodobacteraceae bacterium]|nr:TldD/PmbA family protein [Paracoccaceae bacterium]
MADLEKLTAKMLEAAKRAGAEAADAIVIKGESLSIEVANGALEHAERAEGIDLGLRVMIGQRSAVVSVSDASDATIAVMAERGVAMAKAAPEDPYIGLAEPEQLATDWDVGALELVDPAEPATPEALKAMALEAEAAALAVSGISKVDSAGGSYSSSSIHLATSNGFSGGYGRTSTGLYCTAISGEGLEMERDYKGDSRAFAADMMGADEIGRIAGERAVALKGASQPPTGAFPVLFDERVSSTLIGHLMAAINGRAVARGASWLKDAMGERVLPEGMDLVEDPFRKRVGGSKPFDGEGLATQRRAWVKNGVLMSWVLDLATGRQLGMESTGNAARGASSAPSPSVGNLTLTAGVQSRDDLIKAMGTGLIVTSMIGSSVNPNTGEYSRGASGFWVENGEIIRPVNECTVAGNLREMLGGMIAANDGQAHLSRVVPSLLVEGLTIAGS